MTKLLKKFNFKSRLVRLSLGGVMVIVAVGGVLATYWQEVDFNQDDKVNSLDVVEVLNRWGCPDNCLNPTPTIAPSEWTSCEVSPLGVSVQEMTVFNDETGPEVVELAQAGYKALAGSLTCSGINDYFPELEGWTKASICNSLDCLRGRVPGGDSACADVPGGYDYLAYGPERSGGVPLEEQQDLPGATAQAREIANDAGKKLVVSYGTEQLHFEAQERGYGWENAGEVVKLLAPYGDAWLIQAADEWNSNFNQPGQEGYQVPILSQMHFDPGPEWRAEAKKWADWIKVANPNIEIWIQLALHKVGPPADRPSAETLLAYREWLVSPEYGPPVVDRVYISSVYSYPTEWGPVVADQEMKRVFYCACSGVCEGETPSPEPTTEPPVISPTLAPTPPVSKTITLVEEGMTDNKTIPGITILPGYYYRVYENSAYPCGNQGNHQFIIFDKADNRSQSTSKHLFVKFPGGGTGFWYEDPTNAINNGEVREYHSHFNALGLLNQSLNYTWFFRAGVSQEFANGITKRLRENENFRMMIPSYCSHDLYYGKGEYSSVDGFARYGYLAATEAIDYVQANFATNKMVTFGGSAGASGSFNVGKDQDNVAGIIMDSMSTDLSAMRDACLQGINVFGNSAGNANHPCCCPELEADGVPVYQEENGWCAEPYRTTCAETMAERYGFSLGVDEPYHLVDRGEVKVPIFYIWNYKDAGNNAPYLYNNLQASIREHNPGGASKACRVCLPNNDANIGNTCIEDDAFVPEGACNVHVPSGDDEFPELVDDVYDWVMSVL